MNPELLSQLRMVLDNSATAEEFVNRVMVGDCPKCGSSQTCDCESDPEIDDPCVGRCFECGQLWCLDCGEFFRETASIDHDCPAWEDFDFDDDDDDDDDDDSTG